MKIRTKITLLTSALVLISLFFVLGEYFLEQERSGIFLNGIKTEEQGSFSQLVELSGSDIAILASDYTYWDEMVAYVHHPDPVFAEENIKSGLVSFHASEVYVYDTGRKLIYATDKDRPVVPPVFSAELFDLFFKNRLTHFFAKENNVLMEFRVATIHPTNDPERLTEPEGFFVVARRWDSARLASLEAISGSTIVPSNTKIPSLNVASISFPYEVKDWKNHVVETFTVVSPYPIVSSVQQASERQLLTVVISSFLILLLVYIFLQLFVGRPIEALSEGIERKDISLMKKMQKSRSEFGTLAKLVLDFSEHELVLQSMAKDEAILSAVGSGLIAVDRETKITLFNVAAERLLGIKATQAMGLPIDQVFKAETREGKPLSGDNFPLVRALSEKTMISQSVVGIRPDGTKFPAAVTATPVVLGNQIIGAIQDLRDITIEENLERSKRDFISLVSHEFRTPLTSLGWAVEKIESNKNMPPEILESAIPYMRSSLNRIKTLVGVIVEVSKIENSPLITTLTDIEVLELVKRSIEGLKQQIEAKKIIVTINDKTGNKNRVNSDERLLQIIINNLVSNAVRYTNENGKIHITIDKDSGQLAVSVGNTGPGIPVDEQPQMFSKMFRATNAKLMSPDGIGLGLYISKSFLERLGGSISFVSEPDKETVFTMRLPFSS